MNDSIKLFAPKPMRAQKNKSGVKLNFKNLDGVVTPVNCYTPQLEKNSDMTFKVRISRSTPYLDLYTGERENKIENSDKFLFQGDLLEDVEFDLAKMKEESTCKSEILSILRTNSDNFESTMYTSNNLFNEMEQSDDSFDVRTSMPPIRPQNPFFKNFGDEARGRPDLINNLQDITNNFDENFNKLCNLDDSAESYFCKHIWNNYDPK